jgi:zinc protease
MKTLTPAGLAPVRQTLPNGAVIVAKESRATPAVTIHAAFAAGSIYDPEGQEGLAHFVSRMVDRGSVTYTADQIADELERRGASIAVSCGRHTLSAVCTCLEEDFEAVLALVADVVTRPVFPDAEIAVRRGEIATLIRQDEDSPAAMATQGLFEMMYGSAHPYGRRLRGTVEGIEEMDRAAMRAFHRARFCPSTLSLVIVGDVEARHAIEAAAVLLEDWAQEPAAPPELSVVDGPHERRTSSIRMPNKAQADIAYGLMGIARSDSSYYAHWLMNNILGQYALGGRLGDSIREAQGMAYYVFSSLDANVIPGPLVVRAGVAGANVDRAVASIDAELVKMAAEGPTELEVTESKQYLVGSMPINLETNIGIATFLQTAEFFGLGLDYDLRLPELLRAVTRDQVHESAARTLDTSRATVVVAGPYAGSLS